MSEKTFEEVLDEYGFLCWKAVGTSMLPLIREGKDLFVVRKHTSGRLKRYDAVLFKRPSADGRDAYILHRILKVNEDGSYWIVGDNCTYGETVWEENVLGVLTAVSREGRMVDADRLPYRLYVRLWCAPYPVRFRILKAKGRLRRTAGGVLRAMPGSLRSSAKKARSQQGR